MAIDNMISVEFTDQELTKLGNALNEVMQLLSGKVVNLSPDERMQYGSIADKNKVFVDKCKAYMEQDPTTVPNTLNKHEFDKDYKARQQMEEPLRMVLRIAEMLSDTKILLDFDNYNGSISYYRYVKFLATQNTPGITSVYEDLRQHFERAAKGSKAKAQDNKPEPPKTPQGE